MNKILKNDYGLEKQCREEGLGERRKEGNSGEVELAVWGVGRTECEYVKLSSGTYS